MSFSNVNAANQTATDALVKVDGISYTRTTNTLTDVLPGTTLDLKTVTSGAANLSLVRDNTALKEKFKALVTSYNDATSMLNVVTDPKSTMETYGATLVGDSTARSVKAMMRTLVQGVLAGAPNAVAVAKQVLRQGQPNMDEMIALSAALFDGPEAAEGMRAFAEKRPPSWAVTAEGS